MAHVATVEAFEDDDGWHWQSKSRKGEVVATSHRGYESRGMVEDITGAIFPDIPVFFEDDE